MYDVRIERADPTASTVEMILRLRSVKALSSRVGACALRQTSDDEHLRTFSEKDFGFLPKRRRRRRCYVVIVVILRNKYSIASLLACLFTFDLLACSLLY